MSGDGRTGRRLATDVRRGDAVTIVVDGEHLTAFEGESIAAALLAEDRRVLRFTAGRHAPRGIFCGMGICFDCVVVVDGTERVRSCVTAVRNGMTVTTSDP